MFPRILFFILAIPAALPAAAETYIVPMWLRGLDASDGRWYAPATVVNGNSFPVTYRVTRIFPLQTEPCPVCTDAIVEGRVEPLSSAPLKVGGLAGQALIAGALEVETSAPLTIHVVAYRTGGPEIRQRLDVGQRWLVPGRHLISTVERTGVSWRINVFVTNPNDEPVTVSVWAGDRIPNEVRATVGPRSTAVVAVRLPQVPGTTEYPPSMIPVSVESPATIFASASSLSTDWAVFSIADEAGE